MGFPDPELPDTKLFVTVFYRNFQADTLALQEQIKDLQACISALREFVTVGKPVFWPYKVSSIFSRPFYFSCSFYIVD